MKKKKAKASAHKKSAARKTKTTNTTRAKNEVKGKPPKAELRHVAWSAIEAEELNPLAFPSLSSSARMSWSPAFC